MQINSTSKSNTVVAKNTSLSIIEEEPDQERQPRKKAMRIEKNDLKQDVDLSK